MKALLKWQQHAVRMLADTVPSNAIDMAAVSRRGKWALEAGTSRT